MAQTQSSPEPCTTAPVVGVLALQGDFAEHCQALTAEGLATREVRTPEALQGLAGLVLPGGESTTMLRLLASEGLEAPLRTWLAQAQLVGVPVLGTCAGLILLAEGVHSPSGIATQRSFGLLPVDVDRNGYGRQVHSGRASLIWSDGVQGVYGPHGGDAAGQPADGVFIRAPRITAVRAGVEVLATRELPDGVRDPVLVRRGATMGACFHPELEHAHPVTALFATMVRARSRALDAGSGDGASVGTEERQPMGLPQHGLDAASLS